MPASQPEVAPHAERFVHNVLWGWLGVLFALISGVFLSPYVIHHVGDECYGIWALAFSFVDYYAVVDFGFKSAVLKYSAHYRVTGETDLLDTLISTALLYYSIAALAVAGATVVVAQYSARLFRVSPANQPALRFLLIAVGVGCALGIIFGTFSAVLEGYGRFDITSRRMMLSDGVRVIGCFAVLSLGWGLRAMGICALASQVIGHVFTYTALRRSLPGRVFSPRKARLTMLRQMLGYGGHTFIANMSLNVLNQDAPLLLGHFLSATYVGYFTYPVRLLNYPAELVGRLATVTGAKAAEFAARNDIPAVSRLAVIVNRYCLTLFLPLAVYLVVFGRQLLQVWINPQFAAHGAPLLPVLAAGVVIAIAAQYNSAAVLYGIAKHASYARAVFAEAAASVAGLWYVIPRYGLMAAACLISALMIVARGLYVPYSVSRHVKIGYFEYLWKIYSRPVLTMAPIAAVAWLLNRAAGEPATWGVVLGGGAAVAACCYTAAYFWAVEPEHRRYFLDPILSRLRAWAPQSGGGLS